jgi:hypothetical protein
MQFLPYINMPQAATCSDQIHNKQHKKRTKQLTDPVKFIMHSLLVQRYGVQTL